MTRFGASRAAIAVLRLEVEESSLMREDTVAEAPGRIVVDEVQKLPVLLGEVHAIS